SEREQLHVLSKYLLHPESHSTDIAARTRPLRIVLYEGVYDIMDYTAEQFRKCFEALGHEVFIFQHHTITSSCNALLDFCRDGVDAAIVFNNIGLFLKTDTGENLWDALNIPCIDYLFDHPMYYYDSLDEAPASCIVSCVDRAHVTYIQHFYPAVRHSFFLPLGGEELSFSLKHSWSERSIPVLYVGSLKEVSDIKEDPLMEQIVQFMIAHPALPTETAIPQCLSEMNEFANCSVEEIKQIIQRYRFADTNVNSFYRKKMITVLVDAGIDVTVYGKGWDHTELMQQTHFHYGGNTTQSKCLHLMHDSQIVLNSMPWFKDGAHDRIFNAMLAGAVSVTDPSRYLLEQFGDGTDLFYYQLEHIEQLPSVVKNILSDPASATVAHNGYEKARSLHTWQNRSIELLEHIISEKIKEI
ncbi:MAG TPA: glycosyltransferase, partial [Lachnospiraceae bacterium]|nr:glycosyltransferase [Lachnospiraceae bacterium]